MESWGSWYFILFKEKSKAEIKGSFCDSSGGTDNFEKVGKGLE